MILQIIGLVACFLIACVLGAGSFAVFSAACWGGSNRVENLVGWVFLSSSLLIFWYVFSHFHVSFT
jgi:hypothetical protein